MSRPRATIDLPSGLDLLDLVADFLEQEITPAQADEKLRYRSRVAANLLRIARREFESVEELDVDLDGRAVPQGLITGAGSLRLLTEDLAAGRKSITDPLIFELATLYVDAKLKIAMPEILSQVDP
jgi:Domain of unknown function (DUF6285)